eukprot:2473593-Alexandrium_andersonii.AAC.1
MAFVVMLCFSYAGVPDRPPPAWVLRGVPRSRCCPARPPACAPSFAEEGVRAFGRKEKRKL